MTGPRPPAARGIDAFQSYAVTVQVNNPTPQPSPPDGGRKTLFANAPPDDGQSTGGSCTYTYFGTGWANNPPSPNAGDFLISVSCTDDINTSMTQEPLPEDGDCMMYTGAMRAICLGVDVATIPGRAPANGQCDGSPNDHKIGADNMPAASNTWATTIAQIMPITGPLGVVAYVYQTENQTLWFQVNPGASSSAINSLAGALKQIPILGTLAPILDATATLPVKIDNSQMQAIQGSMKPLGYGAHRCWTLPYNGQAGP